MSLFSRPTTTMYWRSLAGKFSKKKQVKQSHFLSYNWNNSTNTSVPTCDHDYTTIWGPMSIGAEVEVNTERSLPNSDSWREGRRIVNLGVVVDGLKDGCGRCHQLLQLTDCVGESMFGLGGFLRICCSHCTFLNNIPIDTRHGPFKNTWDVNTKIASGRYNIFVSN